MESALRGMQRMSASCLARLREVLLLLVLAMPAGWGRADNDGVRLPGLVTEFFDLNCYECHNEVDRKGELDLESLRFDPADPAIMDVWELIHDRVRDEEMPPKEDSLVEEDERAQFLNLFENTLYEVSRKRLLAEGRVRARRMSRIEFENTIHDLLGTRIPLRDLLPEDQETGGFDHIAESQQMSYHLLERYLEAIDLALDEVFRRATTPDRVYQRRYPPSELGVGLERSTNERQGIYYNGVVLSYPTTHGYHGRMPATTVPETGWYRVRVRARAHNPPPGRNVWARIETGILRAKAPATYWVGMFEATDEPREYSFEAWIRKDHMIGIQPVDRTLEWVPVKAIQDQSVLASPAVAVAIEGVEIERIYPGLSPGEMRRRLFGDLRLIGGELVSERPEQDLERLMRQFAERAFRRPVDASALAPYVAFAQAELASSGSLIQALRAGYRVLLCSYRFLYFIENPGRLDDFSVASRLSYFLWSTLPDGELIGLAREGKLTNSEVLLRQVERMLADPKAAALVENFANSWLNLRDINFTTPDADLYPEFDNILLHSMLDETYAFLSEMIRKDLSVANVIDSDFTFLNERLAQHYGVEWPGGTGLRKVAVASKHRRGGLITQASVLKVTANGTTTSPVVRGVWLLERILGRHIPPPPSQVPAIEPDVRGAVSIRDQLEKHRSRESCMACHRKIDPPGFALENYDVIGGWRKNYRAIASKGKWISGAPIDASYQMSDGRSFNDIDGFKEITLSDTRQIARNLVNQVMTYATGAEIEFADRREIERIQDSLERKGYGFRSLIHAVVQSDIFLSR